jgi:hypothetical protein
VGSGGTVSSHAAWQAMRGGTMFATGLYNFMLGSKARVWAPPMLTAR